MDRRSVKKLTLASLLASLQVIMLYMASLFSVIDLTLAAATVFVMMFAVSEIKGKWCYGIYATVSILSLVLLPVKFAAVVYTAFVGWYPIFKSFTERKLGRITSFFVKLAVFNVSYIAIIEICKRLLFMQDAMGLDPQVYYIVMLAMGNLTFVMFDVMLTLVNTLYVLKLRKRFRVDKFLK